MNLEILMEYLIWSDTRLISMPGCEIPDKTPHENLRAHAEALRDYGAN